MVESVTATSTRFAPSPGERFESDASFPMQAVGHADLTEPPRLSCAELLQPGERESLKPMAVLAALDDVRSRGGLGLERPECSGGNGGLGLGRVRGAR